MIARLLIAGVATGALAFAGGATAKARHHHATAHGMTGVAYTYAAPAQPIPYSDVDHYLHASHAERQSMQMAAANSSATSAAMPAAAETAAPASTQPPSAPAPTDSTPSATTPPTSATPPAAPPATEASPANPPPSESPPMTPPATKQPAPPQ
jgi:hypothetical protein